MKVLRGLWGLISALSSSLLFFLVPFGFVLLAVFVLVMPYDTSPAFLLLGLFLLLCMSPLLLTLPRYAAERGRRAALLPILLAVLAILSWLLLFGGRLVLSSFRMNWRASPAMILGLLFFLSALLLSWILWRHTASHPTLPVTLSVLTLSVAFSACLFFGFITGQSDTVLLEDGRPIAIHRFYNREDRTLPHTYHEYLGPLVYGPEGSLMIAPDGTQRFVPDEAE